MKIQGQNTKNVQRTGVYKKLLAVASIHDLFVSTLDGSLHALNKQTGDLKWTVKDGKQGTPISP